MAAENEFQKLRERLESNDVTLQDETFTSTLPSLLEILGHPMGEIRDNLGWATLSEYFQSSLCPPEVRIETIHFLLTDKFLFYKIKSGESADSVKRTFSTLTIADVIGGDIKFGQNLSPELLNHILQNLYLYLSQEKDWRGHDSQLGWVHSIAHACDAFWAVASHPNLDSENLFDSLKFLLSFIESTETQVFKWQEDYRLGRALSVILNRAPELECENLINKTYSKDAIFSMPALQNLLTTLRCVYLEMLWAKSTRTSILNSIKEIIY